MKKTVYIFALALLLTLTGCAEHKAARSDTGTSGHSDSDSSASSAFSEETAIVRNPEELFSQRDLEADYNQTEAIVVSLNGNSAACNSEAVAISGSTITISQEGTYLLSGTLEQGMVIVDAADTDKVQLVLDNASIQCDSGAPIYVRQADKVFLTLAPESENTLTASGEFVQIDDNNIDAAIFSKDDLTLNGSGILNIYSSSGHGIVSKDDLVITGGTCNIQAARHGLSGKDSVCIAGGDFTIDAGTDGIHSGNEDDPALGFLYIAGGTFHITAGDDGMHTDADFTLADGFVTISKSYEGIEGKTILIRDGTVNITSSDDGLNASDGSGSKSSPAGPPSTEADSSVFLRITGGTLTVDAGGDGLDSNGNLYVEGGELYISGSENGGNSALDYNGEGKITGGTLAAAGFSNMAQNFGDTSSQGTMLVTFAPQEAGTEISLISTQSDTLISYTPPKQYDSIVFSHPDVTSGSTYTVRCGTVDTEVTMDATVYGNTSGMPGRFQPPESPEGERPEAPDGQIPNAPDGQKPNPPDGQALPDGQAPPDGENPEFPGEQAPPDEV